MVTYQVDILNPKAEQLLLDLADMNLIALKEAKSDPFLNVVERLREKASTNPPTLDDITAEVEAVRSER
ncbi:hypothetical protein [Spirosoma linguale]|uniref:Uncharacterized protein n=1 Tax=Spirosoma linguale (strain ATCC 33905 / DSM 74 / LMG 10896 / Claus 1) TaxID=504472 RepID=D2QGL3_SPILD|nr:hypothetical protein Slin_2503 [Spirosoma linguale DSM 74]